MSVKRESFDYFVLSNSNIKSHPDNWPNHFVNVPATPLILDDSINWEVALHSLQMCPKVNGPLTKAAEYEVIAKYNDFPVGTGGFKDTGKASFKGPVNSTIPYSTTQEFLRRYKNALESLKSSEPLFEVTLAVNQETGQVINPPVYLFSFDEIAAQSCPTCNVTIKVNKALAKVLRIINCNDQCIKPLLTFLPLTSPSTNHAMGYFSLTLDNWNSKTGSMHEHTYAIPHTLHRGLFKYMENMIASMNKDLQTDETPVKLTIWVKHPPEKQQIFFAVSIDISALYQLRENPMKVEYIGNRTEPSILATVRFSAPLAKTLGYTRGNSQAVLTIRNMYKDADISHWSHHPTGHWIDMSQGSPLQDSGGNCAMYGKTTFKSSGTNHLYKGDTMTLTWVFPYEVPPQHFLPPRYRNLGSSSQPHVDIAALNGQINIHLHDLLDELLGHDETLLRSAAMTRLQDPNARMTKVALDTLIYKPIRGGTRNITQLEISLTDEFGVLLDLPESKTTCILSFRPMLRRGTSDISMQVTCNERHKLHNPWKLDNDPNWKVALTEVTFPMKWKNIEQQDNAIIVEVEYVYMQQTVQPKFDRVLHTQLGYNESTRTFAAVDKVGSPVHGPPPVKAGEQPGLKHIFTISLPKGAYGRRSLVQYINDRLLNTDYKVCIYHGLQHNHLFAPQIKIDSNPIQIIMKTFTYNYYEHVALDINAKDNATEETLEKARMAARPVTSTEYETATTLLRSEYYRFHITFKGELAVVLGTQSDTKFSSPWPPEGWYESTNFDLTPRLQQHFNYPGGPRDGEIIIGDAIRQCRSFQRPFTSQPLLRVWEAGFDNRTGATADQNLISRINDVCQAETDNDFGAGFEVVSADGVQGDSGFRKGAFLSIKQCHRECVVSLALSAEMTHLLALPKQVTLRRDMDEEEVSNLKIQRSFTDTKYIFPMAPNMIVEETVTQNNVKSVTHTFSNVIDTQSGYDTFFIYMDDIVSSSPVGDADSAILTWILPGEVKNWEEEGDTRFIQVSEPQYMKVRPQTVINEFTVMICNEMGEPVDFQGQKACATLHFQNAFDT